ncbi:RagB/SusD family nutrient uptake outer membrane protein [Arenibacter sp. S6351L]|uniref:RagB/SusD family nutrient uptake outer membrane protein n=1 Tax=Arenibacter sp. S6351L TaxID=2926407 RepID=UPI001FF6C75B|nr:RagB/SusD family nutrient uptake outer membrane protein [Arenibacter sp. S6351L]MCK0136012.1 RagB/SusD family nutrient uptake outer membrane protein [Arenibacter sp. S6351L]
MKYLNRIFTSIVVILLLGLFTISCEKLEEEPFSFESASNTFQNIENFENLVNGATRILQSIDYYGLTSGSKAIESNPTIDTYSFTPADFEGYWSDSYRAINNLNSIIENITLAQNGTEAQRDKILGKSYFLRAFTYFNLVRFYGDVPLILSGSSSLDNVGVSDPRMASVDVYAQIIADFQLAESLLGTANLPGEPTVWAAKAYLSKVYLTMAGAPLKLTENYEKAASKAKEIIDSEAFQLGAYVDNFVASNQDSSSSILFQFIYSTDAGSAYSNPLFGRTSVRNGITNPGSRAYRRYMDEFPDGPRKETTFYMNTDPVIDNFLNETDGNGNYSNQAYRNANKIGEPDERKYFLKDALDTGFIKKYTYGAQGAEGDQSDQNLVMFRYAEVLLIYAEAQNLADNGANNLSYELLNSVRTRGRDEAAAIPPMSLSTSEFDKIVIEERYWEFGYEMKRWFDVLRKEIPLTFDIYTGGEYEEFTSAFPDRYLFPIPQREIELNPNLTQNIGY